ncbi:MAG: endonuclease [Flavobacteriaceae bacterium]
MEKNIYIVRPEKNIMKKLLLLVLPLFGFGQMPAYYNGIDFNQTGDALKVQLTSLITSTHTTELYYTSSQLDTWDALKQTDLDPTNSSNVFLLYGYDAIPNDAGDTVLKDDRVRDESLSCHQSGCNGLWVREHVFPKSLANPTLDTGDPGAGTDAHSLRACDSQMNGSRGNKPFGDGSGNSSILPTTGYWYPGDEWRGDVARMMMYMYVRYPSQCKAIDVGTGSTSYSNFGDMPNIFLEWNEEDPVSQYEINRNNILEGIQGNRNPFIDNPYLATMIWNGPSAQDNWNILATDYIEELSAIKLYPTVTSDVVFINNASQTPYNYSIVNSLGQQLKTGEALHSIELSEFEKGFYFINLQLNNAQKTFKIILK